MNKILYFHGGPGLNSNPENVLLKDKFLSYGLDLQLWNEPSSQRPELSNFEPQNAFDNYLKEAEKFLLTHSEDGPVTLMGHSYGVNALKYLIKNHPTIISQVIYVSPDFRADLADRNIWKLAMLDAKESGNNELAGKLEKVLQNNSDSFEVTKEGFELALQNPNIFSYYWENEEAMNAYLPNFSGPEYEIDILGFMSVRATQYDISLINSHIPALAVFGKKDIIISVPDEVEVVKKAHRQTEIQFFEASGHYPHIEQSDEFLELIMQNIPETPRPLA